MPSNNRIEQYDFIKGIAIFSVILHHIFITISSNNTGTVQYTIGHAVPLFLLVSILLNYQRFENNSDYTVNWCKILKRILTPFALIQVIIFPVIIYYHIDLRKFIVDFGFGMGTYFIPIYLQIIFFCDFFYKILNSNFIKGSLTILFVHLFTEFTFQLIHIPEELYRLIFTRYIFLYPVAFLFFKRQLLYKFRHLLVVLIVLGFFLQYVTISKSNYLFLYPSYGFISHKFYTNFISLFYFVSLYSIANYIPGNKYIKYCGFKSYYIYLLQMAIFPWYLMFAKDMLTYHLLPLTCK